MDGASSEGPHPSTRWLSEDFGSLVREVESGTPPLFDLLVIGSGYGGAMALAELAGCVDGDGRPLQVALIERGQEYLPGSFPSAMTALPGHLRFAATAETASDLRGREGLFDLRLGGDVGIVSANGLGGGSLINAGVMEVPRPEIFDAHWPESVRDDLRQGRFFVEAKRRLGALRQGSDEDNTIEHSAAHRARPLRKHQALKRMAGDNGRFRPAALSIAMQDTQSAAGVPLSACKLCGDCATGCNFGAKESLDTNLLVHARRRGARIYTGGLALHVVPGEGDAPWQVHTTYTDTRLAQRQGAPVVVRAKRVIIAAGAPASTEILQRSARLDARLRLSDCLGTRFSGNGDMIAAAYAEKHEVNAVADAGLSPDNRYVGPTITGIIDIEGEAGSPALTIEELAIPAPLKRAFEELATTVNTLHALGSADPSSHQAGWPSTDPFAVDQSAIRRTQVLAAMGDDGAGGRIVLAPDAELAMTDGLAKIAWPEARRHPLFDTQIRTLTALSQPAELGGSIIANPAWKLLPESMSYLVGGARGPVLTVHPLGGCPMGETVHTGVVDAIGRVFDAGGTEPTQVHEGLVVLDASIVPRALGTNPALTITALSLRATRALRQQWGWQSPTDASVSRFTAARPRSAPAPTPEPAEASARRTVGIFTERLTGPLSLQAADGGTLDCIAELTLCFEPLALLDLVRGNGARKPALQVRPASASHPDRSQLRLFDRGQWTAICHAEPNPERREQRLAEVALLVAPVSGVLEVFAREASTHWQRRLRALRAWWRNRGARDIWQHFSEPSAVSKKDDGPGLLARARDAWRLASRVGEVRRFDYRLRVGPHRHRHPDFRWIGDSRVAGLSLTGCKRITYGPLASPLRQLTEMTITALPGLAGKASPVLALDPGFLAGRGAPLFQILGQQDQASALADMASLGAYVLRMLLGLHIWTLRQPEHSVRPPQRLPGRLPNLPEPEVVQREVDRLDGAPVHIRLTRYARPDSDLPPVVMIHGYSASGTTFAHPALEVSAASHLWQQGRDVWILDLRSSCGMPTASKPWTFELIALGDIPVAIEHVCEATGRPQVDVIAHCMGAAMFGMAVLSADRPAAEVMTPVDAGFADPFREARRQLPDRIRRAVLSQVGPLIVLSAENVFRAYLMQYLRHFVPGTVYDFRSPGEAGSLAEQLLDRLLSALPYPDEELRIEQPRRPWRRTPYVATRHRMDALYGRTFKLAHLSPEVLAHIDDFFGPVSIETVSQPVHFAREQMVTNRFGRNRFVSRQRLRRHWRFPTLSIHGEENGLAHPATMARMRAELKDAGCEHHSWMVPGFGHQDCWIGRDASRVFERVADFLAEPDSSADAATVYTAVPCAPMVCVPAGGPVQVPVVREAGGGAVVPVMVDSGHALERPLYLLLWDEAAADAESALRGLLPLPQAAVDWCEVDVPVEMLPEGREVLALLVHNASTTLRAPSFRVGSSFNVMSKAVPTAFNDGAAAEAKLFKDRIPNAVESYLRTVRPEQLLPARLCRPARDTASESLCLALGSCQYPHGLVDAGPAYASWAALAARLESDAGKMPGLRPDLLMLTGDQIYADMTAGLFDPTQLDERYGRAYERWLHRDAVRRVTRQLPLLTMLDDHEIDDNWEPVHPDFDPAVVCRNQTLLAQGRAHYLRHQRRNHDADAPLWYTTEDFGLPIFVADTRTEREHRTAGRLHTARIMSMTQWAALRDWLLRQPAHLPKIIVCPSAVLPRHRYAMPSQPSSMGNAPETTALWSDTWDGYPASLHALLGTIAEHRIRGLVFLSGDEHLGMMSSVRLLPEGAPEHEGINVQFVHTGALYAPYPFANAQPDDLLGHERFSFDHQADAGLRRYTCSIETDFVSGSGFSLVQLSRQTGGWRLVCEFMREGADGAAACPIFERELEL
jgi:cholesterol oxidase